ncbi:hypothetical protein JZM32_07730 [Acinetobacter pittii]|uniref:hypothetical protein n=1 Tax=Acinetobacter pittii TaxID=48296 RepID=UPI00198129C5|nr:hypothetical protein [Acinetobacter pittii]MBN6527879.1 hypothetical protein [Acinetobacter pittii]
MGNPTHFLVDRVGKNLDDAIELLAQVSTEFKGHWQRNYRDRCNETSEIALKNFDFIVNEILRKRDDLAYCSDNQYINAFKILLSYRLGKIAVDITPFDLNIFDPARVGNAILPVGRETKKISLSRLLNKIKHRCTYQINFRIENDEHILVIGADKFRDEPKSIVEFNVREFCEECQKVSELIKSKTN